MVAAPIATAAGIATGSRGGPTLEGDSAAGGVRVVGFAFHPRAPQADLAGGLRQVDGLLLCDRSAGGEANFVFIKTAVVVGDEDDARQRVRLDQEAELTFHRRAFVRGVAGEAGGAAGNRHAIV